MNTSQPGNLAIGVPGLVECVNGCLLCHCELSCHRVPLQRLMLKENRQELPHSMAGTNPIRGGRNNPIRDRPAKYRSVGHVKHCINY